MFDGVEAAALAVTVVGVDAGADDQFALVRLADITVYGAGHDHGIQHRFQGFRHVSLQWVALQGQAQPGHPRQHAGMAGDDNTNPIRLDAAAAGLDAGHPAIVPVDAGDLALLDNIDSQGIGGAGKPPGHRVVAGNPAPALQRGPKDWITHPGRGIDHGDGGLDLRRRDHLGVNPVQAVGADPPFYIPHVLQAVAQVINAALAEHDVVIQVPAQPFPQFQRLLIEQRGFRPKVI